jgi:cytochrome c biogenesis factor
MKPIFCILAVFRLAMIQTILYFLVITGFILSGITLYKKNISAKVSETLFFIWAASILVVHGTFLLNIFLENRSILYIAEKLATAPNLKDKIIIAFASGSAGMFFWISAILVIGTHIAYRIKDTLQLRIFVTTHLFLVSALLMSIAGAGDFASVTGGETSSGIHPLLNTWWSAIHPVFMFSGYAVCFNLFSLTLSHVMSDNSPESKYIPVLQKSGFLLIGAGLLTGGIWAYMTPGWGGWWNWDPVEVCALLPWIAFIPLIIKERVKTYESMIPFVMGLLSALMIRSGAFSGLSTHTYSGINYKAVIALGVLAVLSILLTLLVILKNRNQNDKSKSEQRLINYFVYAITGVFLFGLVHYLFKTFATFTKFNFNNPGEFYLPILSLIAGLFVIISSIRKKQSLKYYVFALLIALAVSGLLFIGGNISANILILSCLLVFYSANRFFRIAESKAKNLSLIFILSGAVLLVMAGLVEFNYKTTEYIEFQDEINGEISGKPVFMNSFKGDSTRVDIHFKNKIKSTGINYTLFKNSIFPKEEKAIFFGVFENTSFILKELPSVKNNQRYVIAIETSPFNNFIWLAGLLMIIGAVTKKSRPTIERLQKLKQ